MKSSKEKTTLVLSRETLRDLHVRSNVRTGLAAPLSDGKNYCNTIAGCRGATGLDCTM